MKAAPGRPRPGCGGILSPQRIICKPAARVHATTRHSADRGDRARCAQRSDPNAASRRLVALACARGSRMPRPAGCLRVASMAVRTVVRRPCVAGRPALAFASPRRVISVAAGLDHRADAACGDVSRAYPRARRRCPHLRSAGAVGTERGRTRPLHRGRWCADRSIGSGWPRTARPPDPRVVSGEAAARRSSGGVLARRARRGTSGTGALRPASTQSARASSIDSLAQLPGRAADERAPALSGARVLARVRLDALAEHDTDGRARQPRLHCLQRRPSVRECRTALSRWSSRCRAMRSG